MDSFYHEIPCPDDRAIQQFLWLDFFHDARMERIEYNHPSAGDVTVQLHAQAWPGDDVWRTIPAGTHEEQQAYYEQHLRPRRTYHLRFHRIRHFQHLIDSECRYEEVLCMRFRNTPLLRRLQASAGKPLYHLRVNTSTGALDVIFERFSIRKQEGRIHYDADFDETRNFWWECMKAEASFTRQRLDGIAEHEMSANDLTDWLMCRLFEAEQAGDPELMRSAARQVLQTDSPDLWPADSYAIRLLGFHGDAGDIPALLERYLDPERGSFAMLETRDAIERIRERETGTSE